MTDASVGRLGEGDDSLPELYRSGRAKQRRSKVRHLAAYSVGIIVIVVFVATADWARIGDKYFNVDVAKGMFPDVITIAAKNTLVYTLFSFTGGVVLGLT